MNSVLMNTVNKRMLSLAFVVVAAITLGACQGGEVAAVTVGDRSTSRAALTQLVPMLQGGTPLDSAELDRIPGGGAREGVNFVVQTLAANQYLEDQGVVMSDTDRRMIEEGWQQQFVLSELLPGTLDVIVAFEWANQNVALLQTESGALGMTEIFNEDVTVDSRLGVWVPDQASVVPSSALDQSLGTPSFG